MSRVGGRTSSWGRGNWTGESAWRAIGSRQWEYAGTKSRRFGMWTGWKGVPAPRERFPSRWVAAAPLCSHRHNAPRRHGPPHLFPSDHRRAHLLRPTKGGCAHNARTSYHLAPPPCMRHAHAGGTPRGTAPLGIVFLFMPRRRRSHQGSARRAAGAAPSLQGSIISFAVVHAMQSCTRRSQVPRQRRAATTLLRSSLLSPVVTL